MQRLLKRRKKLEFKTHNTGGRVSSDTEFMVAVVVLVQKICKHTAATSTTYKNQMVRHEIQLLHLD